MSGRSNLESLKAAYRAWHESKGARTDVWLDLFADSVSMHTMAGASRGLAFAKPSYCRDDAVAYFTALLDDWQMIHWTPEDFVVDGDRIAMFGHCAWIFKATGKPVEISIAHLWRFDDGKVVEVREVFDSASVAAAAMPERGDGDGAPGG